MNNSQSTEYRLLELGQLPRVWGGGEGQWLEAWGARARKQGGVWECGLAATAVIGQKSMPRGKTHLATNINRN